MALYLIFTMTPAYAQVLQADWTKAAAKRIDQQRKTPLRVIVLDGRGEIVPNTKVQLTQIDHAFSIGFVPPASGWPAAYGTDKPGWRVFNAVSLDRLSDWPALQPRRGQPLSANRLNAAIVSGRQRRMAVHWGGVLAADSARNAEWTVPLKGADLRDALRQYAVDQVTAAYRDDVQSFDLYTHPLDHSLSDQGLGKAFVRQLFQRAGAASPRNQMHVRFYDSLTGERQNAMLRTARAMREAFIRYEAVTIEHQFDARLNRARLRKALNNLAALQAPVMLEIEARGASEADAAIHMETILRLAFAEPSVEGLYFDALTPGTATRAESSLFDREGELTEVGRIIDTMFHRVWRTNRAMRTDQLGNIETRVFAGRYRLTATIDGEQVSTRLRLPMSEAQRIVVLQPAAVEEPTPLSPLP